MSKEKEFVSITSISGELLDSKDRTYKRIEASPLQGFMFNPQMNKQMPVVDISIEPVSFNQHEDPWDDGKSDKLYNVALGTILPGRIVKKTVPAYDVPNKTTGEINSRTVRNLFVAGDTTDEVTFLAETVKEFNKQKHFLKADGTPDLERAANPAAGPTPIVEIVEEEQIELSEEETATVPSES